MRNDVPTAPEMNVERLKMPAALLWASCGTQRLLRPLSGPCILLATAPTAPPCFGRRPQSSPLHIQRKNDFKLSETGRPAGCPVSHFHQRGRKGKRHRQRLSPAETAALWMGRLLAVTSPFVKKQFRNARRRFGTANKNNNSTDDGQSAAEAILIVKATVEALLLSCFTVKAKHLHLH